MENLTMAPNASNGATIPSPRQGPPMEIFYFHGGPGLNAHPEQNMLDGIFGRYGWSVKFWNEPSRLRPEGPAWADDDAFNNYLEKAGQFLMHHQRQEKVVVIGHSFGAHAARYLSKMYPDRCLMCVMIASDLALQRTDINMFSFTLADYRKSGNPAASVMKSVIDNYSGAFDQNTARGFELVVQNPALFDHYWVDNVKKEAFLRFLSHPSYGLDFNGFLAVRQSWRDVPLEGCAVPSVAMFGKHDNVISAEAEIDILKRCYSNLVIHEFEHSAHYPHLEESELFCQVLEQEITAILTRAGY